MTASYLHDSLWDLASAARAFRDGADSVTCVFMDEPGEHHLTFRRLSDTEAEVRIDWYSDWKSWGTTASAEPRLRARTRPAHIAGQVLSAMRRILETHGEAGCRAQWINHDSPSDEYRPLLAGRNGAVSDPRRSGKDLV